MTLHHMPSTALVAGGAGFVGSHLCDALLASGMRVICVDNFQTGRRQNVDPLRNNRGFRLVEADVATRPASRRAGSTGSSTSPRPPLRRITRPIRSAR